MKQIEQFNLYWLAEAMTDSTKSAKHYYYDSRDRSFFYSKTPAGYDGVMEFYKPMGLAIKGDDYYELFIRLVNPYISNGGIIEIVKLDKIQKRNIQWRFLNKFGGHKYHFKYFMAVIDQTEEEHFVLDKMITGNGDDHLFLLWDAFKLDAIRMYVTNFAKAAGVEIDLSA